MSLAYFPFYPSDYEAKTAHLSLEEDGCYNRLLRLCWSTPGCSLPDDRAWLMRRLRVDEETFDRVAVVVIAEFFKRRRGRIYNPRLTEVFEETCRAHNRRVKAGKKGGRPSKSLKTNETGQSNAKALRKQPEPELKEYSVTNVTGGSAAAPVDFTKEVFDRGVAFLGKYGTSERQARALIGKWRKEAGDTETFNALRDASREGVTEPVAWVTARLSAIRAGPVGVDLASMFAKIQGEMQ